MYKVFLVDDEIVVREGIRNSIQWDETDYSLSGEAPDGEMALSIMKEIKPDILVTDIKMPFMDGLALSRVIKKVLPWVKIIIISGHDEFHYAREAISIGVEEFLLKPVSSGDLLKSLNKVGAIISQEKAELNSLENMKQQVQTAGDIIRERWLWDLVTGVIASEDAIEKARSFQIDLIAPGYLVGVAKIHCPGFSGPELLTAKIKTSSLLLKQQEIIGFWRDPQTFIFVIKKMARETLEETAYSFGQAVKYEIERSSSCQVALGIGSAAERLGGLHHSFSDARKALDFLIRNGEYKIMGVNDIQEQNELDLLRLEGDPLVERLKYAETSDIEEIINCYLEAIGDKPVGDSLISYYVIGDLIIAASKLIDELGGEINEVIPSLSHRSRIEEFLSSREVFIRELRQILQEVIDYRNSRTCGKYHAMIFKARQYIDRHFADPDISLHSVAEAVNVSPNHFSTVFSQETGETFIEYLTSVRLSRSKYLLRHTRMKSADIAYEAGFNDPHYFSFIFKKNTGVSPREFRATLTTARES